MLPKLTNMAAKSFRYVLEQLSNCVVLPTNVEDITCLQWHDSLLVTSNT